ncbi:unnamed protein product [Chrysodeixis includens]|uniref:Condensin II complex subunit H2 N-terminal domain-containing protein n=1 Tax=Chrysodeixis includens TaxID=689277 RepID=A0A9N8L245_CHRIL|nr:unnamed protein product [Chrysodeixis includens]
MDADRQRDPVTARRSSSWSMNSQRLEAIVAELMKPISDARRNFDTDLSALLESYLTEAGLHALDENDDAPPPNFSEVALLLQQSANIYSRKVDYLYQQVLDYSDSLTNSTRESDPRTPRSAAEADGAASGAAGARRARRRRAAAAPGVERDTRERVRGAERGGGGGRGAGRRARGRRPRCRAPTWSWSPRPPRAARRCWTWTPSPSACSPTSTSPGACMSDGFLVDDLQGAYINNENDLRSISLVELQAAITAAAASPGAELVQDAGAPSSPGSPLRASTPLGAPAPPGDALTPPGDVLTPPGDALALVATPRRARNERKRRNTIVIDDVLGDALQLVVSDDLLNHLNELREFSIPSSWITKVVSKRKRHILNERERLRAEEEEYSSELAHRGRRPAGRAPGPARGARAWRPGAPVDVRELGARVLAALQPPAPSPAPFPRLLAGAARDQPDVSRLLLATLFLANSGNVEIIQGPPLTVDTFSVRVLSTDESLFGAIAPEDQFLL